MRFCRVYFWVVLCVAPFATALAQRLAAVTTGTRLRVVTCDGEVVTGEFGGLRGDTLDMAINRRLTSTEDFAPEKVRVARAIALDQIRTYAVFERYESRAGRGALVGSGLGLALIGVARATDLSYERKGGAATIPTIALAVPAALVLVVVGAALGSASGPEQWSMPQIVRASIIPAPTGMHAVLSVRF